MESASVFKTLSKYAKQFKQMQLSWSNGFYILPYFGSSPEDLIEGFDYMPFVEVDKKLGTIKSNSMFLEALTYFYKIKDGFWITYGKVNYKKNISYKRIQDNELDSKYYFLSLEITRSSEKKISTLVNGYLYKDYSWLLFKPEVSNSHSHLSNSLQESCTIWFDENFITEFLSKDKALKDSSLVKFLNAEKKMVLCQAEADFAENISKSISDLFAAKVKGKEIKTDIEKLAISILNTFSKTYSTTEENYYLTQLNPAMIRKMLKAKGILMEYLLRDDFKGIEWLAKKVNISPTSLKQNFKMVFGVSIYKHLKQKKLQYARELLRTTDSDVKEIAFTVGYHNPAKFGTAFKAEFGESPGNQR